MMLPTTTGPTGRQLSVMRDELRRRLGMPELSEEDAHAVFVSFGRCLDPWTRGAGWADGARTAIELRREDLSSSSFASSDGRQDWRELGSTSCACDVRGKNCKCQRLVAVEDHETGVKLRFQPVEDTMKIDSFENVPVARIDAEDDELDPVGAARRRRDKQMADAWKAKDAVPGSVTPRADAISEDDDPVAKARAKRDQRVRDAWRTR